MHAVMRLILHGYLKDARAPAWFQKRVRSYLHQAFPRTPGMGTCVILTGLMIGLQVLLYVLGAWPWSILEGGLCVSLAAGSVVFVFLDVMTCARMLCSARVAHKRATDLACARLTSHERMEYVYAGLHGGVRPHILYRGAPT